MRKPDKNPLPRPLKNPIPPKGIRGIGPSIPLSADDEELLANVVRAAVANPTFGYEFLKTAAAFARGNKHLRAVLNAEMKTQAKKAKMTRGRAPIPDSVCIGLAIAYARRRKDVRESADEAREFLHLQFPEYEVERIGKLVGRGNKLHKFWRIDIDKLDSEIISWDMEQRR